MASYVCSRCALQRLIPRAGIQASSSVPSPATAAARAFTTTPSHRYPRESNGKRFPGRDANKTRFLSAQRGTGLRPRQTLSVKLENLAVPADESSRTPLKVDEDHGLWDFFNRERNAIWTPTELANHGRAWNTQELARKSWQDLHTLWWVCVRERNRLYTDLLERQRLKAGYGDAEGLSRDETLRLTMKNIKFVLTNRYYDWKDARELVEEDPECEITEEGGIRYVPQGTYAYEEDSSDASEVNFVAEAEATNHETGEPRRPEDAVLLGGAADGSKSEIPPPASPEATNSPTSAVR